MGLHDQILNDQYEKSDDGIIKWWCEISKELEFKDDLK